MIHNSAADTATELPPLPTRIARHFAALAPTAAVKDRWHAALEKPLVEFLARPSKQLRARLMDAIFRAAGGIGECPALARDIIEALHAGSLIVDDIEDGSLSRRGEPSLHLQYGTSVALNAGNWLYFWALENLTHLEVPAASRNQLLRETCSVLTRCHEGQALDIGTCIYSIEQSQVEDLVRTTTELKTGALMGLASRLAAAVAGADPSTAAALGDFGAQLGVALQMLDDLSGLINPTRQDKGREDLHQGRPTWPWAWLAESEPGVRFTEIQELAKRANSDERHADELSRRLRAALSGSGRVHVRRHLSSALAELKRASLRDSAFEELSAEIHRLEKSYG